MGSGGLEAGERTDSLGNFEESLGGKQIPVILDLCKRCGRYSVIRITNTSIRFERNLPVSKARIELVN
jgi:hypothetical protein